MQASFLRIKLRDLDASNTRRKAIATRYIAEIKNPKINLPSWSGEDDHVFHLFVIRCKTRAHLCDYLKENGVGTIIHYPVPPHQQEALKD